MKKDLPFLNQERLNVIFDHVYDIVDIGESTRFFEEKKLSDFLQMLKSMQTYNYHHRHDDMRALVDLVDPTVFHFEINSEGTSLWLSLILAIKDLYGFSDKQLLSVVKQISIRK
jgi:hypothetical protein